jgi:hypothetical protein
MARKIEPTKPEVQPETKAANPPVTLTPEALQAVIQQAVAEAMAKAKSEAVAVMNAMGKAGKSESSLKNEIAVVKAFKKAGFGDVTPHKDVMTFNRWMAQGFRPMEGSKSLKVKNLRLFHKTQVRQLTAEERAAMTEQSAAAVKRHDKAKVIPMTSDASPQ